MTSGIFRRIFLGLGLICSLATITAEAQQTTGDILGTVVDETGAVVPEASVTIVSLETHETHVVKSTSSGDFVANLLNPGTYSLTATAKGFKTFAVPSVTLSAGDRVRVNVNLAVGVTSETVTVEAQASELHTDSSVMSHTVDAKQVQDLPLNGRNFVQLVQLAPGVNEGPPDSLTNGSKLDDRRQSASMSVNGQSDVLNNEMIDGADNNERLIGTVAVRPSLEAISEISVQTNTYTAEVGRTGGGIINIITKSGSNQFHGSAFEFFRNNLLDAYTYNFGQDLPKNELRQNQFGGSLGGPIVKNKTFFFGDYEGYRQIAGTAPQSVIVPTLYEEQHPGDFSDTGGPVIAPGAMDKAGLAYFSMFPAPNQGTNTFVGAYKNVQYSNDFDARVDQIFNSNNTFFARFAYNNVYTDSPGIFPDVTVAGITLNPSFIGYGLGEAKDLAYTGSLNYTHTFNANLLLDLKAAYTRVNNQSNPETDGLNPNQAIGQPNINTPISDSTGLAPIVVVTGASLGSVLFQPLKDQDNTYQYMGNLTYTRGAHNFKIGGNFIRRQLTSFQSSYPEGLWIFLDYPGLIQGQYLNTQRSLQLVVPYLRTSEIGTYIQDDWHASKILTINAGLRYDHFTPYTEVHNNISTFNPADGQLQVAGVDGISNTAGIQSDYHGLAPRLGFALTLKNNLVVRGGYGIGYVPMNTTSNANLKNPPFVATVSSCGYFSCGPGYTSFIDGFPLPTPTNINLPGSSIPDAVSPHFRTSYLQQFNLTVQKEVAGNVLTASYVGLLGRQLAQLLPDLNAPPPNTCGSNAACYTPLRPFYAQHPNLGLIGYFQTGGVSSYNSLQTSIERRLNHGLTLNINYTLAHSIDNSTGLSEEGAGGYGSVPSLVDTLEYSNSALDIRNRIAGNIDYQLPWGSGLTGGKALAAQGWQVNVIAVWNTGIPYTVTNANDVSNTNPGANNADRPDRIGNPSVSNQNVNEFFNPAAFQAQAAGTVGTEARNALYGPHYRHLDISFFKTFPLGERFRMEFRAESFNVLNTANFANPNSSLGGANFGQITAMSTAYAPRQFQLALKLTF
jgi:Carboxypeptidase regulatory-like domain/TonB dependent receptor